MQEVLECPPINLHTMALLTPIDARQEVDELTEAGYIQCDPHLRDQNKIAGEQQIVARTKLILRFAPFIWLEDEQREPVDLMETVAHRLLEAADAERARRRAVCPPGFEHLVAK